MSGQGLIPIPSDPGYFVSSDGCAVYTTCIRGRPEPIELRQRENEGYLYVRLRAKDRAIHRIVAATFLGPRPPGMEVRHLDGNKRNNAPANLAYGTRSENIQDRARHGAPSRPPRPPQTKLTPAEVSEIKRLIAEGALMQKDIAARFGVEATAVRKIAKGITWREVPAA